MKKLLIGLALLSCNISATFAACLPCDCWSGTAEVGPEIQVHNWPEDPQTTITVCCGDPIPASEIGPVKVWGTFGTDSDVYTEHRFHKDDKCNCHPYDYVSHPADTVVVEWTGSVDPCSTGPQKIFATFKNPEVYTTNYKECVERDAEDTCVAFRCDEEVPYTVKDDEITKEYTVNVVTLPDGCNGPCHREPGQCSENQVYDATNCTCKKSPPPCPTPPCEPPPGGGCGTPPCDDDCPNPPCEPPPGGCGSPPCEDPPPGGGGGGGGDCPIGQRFDPITGQCVPDEDPPPPPPSCPKGNVWDPELRRCVCADAQGRPISDKPCCREQDKDECGNCPGDGSCTRGSCSAQSGLSASGLSVVTSIGTGAFGNQNPALILSDFSLHEDSAKPKNLELTRGSYTKEIIYDSNVAFRQILTSNRFVDIVTISPNKFEIRQYDSANKGTKDINGHYQPVGSPLQVVTIENPVVSSVPDLDRLLVTRQDAGSDPVIDEFYKSTFSGATRLGQAYDSLTGKFARVEFRQSAWVTYGTEWILTFTVTDGDSNIVSRVNKRYKMFPWGKEMIEEIEETGLPGHGGYSSTWEYYTNPAETGRYSNVKQHIDKDGSWVRYDYDTSGTEIKRVQPFKDSPVTALDNEARVTETTKTVSGNITTTLEVEKVLGTVVSRQYTIYDDSITTSIVCLSPTALPSDPTNLVTVRELFSTGPYKLKEKSILRPDGTMSLTEITNDNDDLIVTKTTGEPNVGKTAIIAGTRVVSRFNPAGVETERAVYDITSNLQIDGMEVVQFDDFGRPIRTEYLDGTWDEALHDCCDGKKSQTDRSGVTTYYTHDALGRTLTQTQGGITTRYAYDAEGRALSTTRIGTDFSEIVQETAAYDWAGDRIWQKDALNNTSIYEHPGNNLRFSKVTNPDGSTIETENWLDGNTKLTTGTAARPSATDYRIESGQLVTRNIAGTNCLDCPNTQWTESFADMANRNVRTLYPEDVEENSYYNGKGQLWRTVDLNGVARLMSYDNQGRQLLQVVDADFDDQIDLDGTDRIIRTQQSVTTEHGKDVVKQTMSQWKELNVDLASVIGENVKVVGSLETYQSSHGLVTSVTKLLDGAGSVTVTTLNPDGSRNRKITSGSQLLEDANFDANLVQIAKTTYTYDPHGRMATSTDARNGTTFYTYDNKDQVLSVTLPPADGSTSAQVQNYTYDSAGNVTVTQLADSSKTYNEYYLTGDLKLTSGSQTYKQEYTYDSQGRRLTLTTDGNRTTTWHYSPTRGWLLSKEYADGNGPNYTYYPGGELASRTWQRGITTTYGYGSTGDLVSIDYSDATPDVAFTYGRRGERLTASDGSGTREFDYNVAGAVTREYVSSGFLEEALTTRDYDLLNRLTETGIYSSEISLTFATSIAYQYDQASRVKRVTGLGETVEYEYESNSSLIRSMTYNPAAPVLRTVRAYDSLNRLTNQTTKRVSDNAVLAEYNYTLNSLNQRTKMATEGSGYWDYAYDGMGQVTSGTKKLPDHTPLDGYDYGYAYDGIGNRTTATVNGRTQIYNANELNQYTQRTVPGGDDVTGYAPDTKNVMINGNGGVQRQEGYYHVPLVIDNSVAPQVTTVDVERDDWWRFYDIYTPATPEQFTYDLDGNLLSDGRWMYTWDGENRLTGMETFTTVPAAAKKKLEFKYDYMSRRVAKTVSNWNAGSSAWIADETIMFYYDGWNIVGEATEDDLVGEYAWGLDLSGSLQGAGGVGGLFALGHGSSPRFVISDGNGNVTKLTTVFSIVAEVTNEYEYGPFGEIITAVDSPRFGFSSKYRDAETGLLYYGYRYYNPTIGRWINRDPIEEDGGVNIYGFLSNSSVSKLDFLGLLILTDVDAEVLRHSVLYGMGLNNGAYPIGFPFPKAPNLTIDTPRWSIGQVASIDKQIEKKAEEFCKSCKKKMPAYGLRGGYDTIHTYSLGEIMVAVGGEIKLEGPGPAPNTVRWTFRGKLIPMPEYFDFRPLLNDRGFWGELMNAFGFAANATGNLANFYIYPTDPQDYILPGITDCNKVN